MNGYSVEFRIFSEKKDFDLNEITRTLGLSPTNTRQRGEIKSLSRVQSESMWGYEVYSCKEWKSLEKGLNSHLKVLMPLKEKIDEYIKKYDVIWWCGLFTDFNEDLKVSPKLLRKLSDFGAQLRLDTYCFTKEKLAYKELTQFYKQKEQLCINRGDNASLLSVFGKQSDVFLAQGKLDRAMKVFKKQEKLLKELGDKSGLARCFGNQADIFSHQDRRDEEMEMLKQQESLLLELRDKKALLECLYNQARNFFYAQAAFDKAMHMFKQRELIFKKLNDVNGRARSVLSQAIISIEMDNMDEALALAAKAYRLAIKFSLRDLAKEAKAFLDFRQPDKKQ